MTSQVSEIKIYPILRNILLKDGDSLSLPVWEARVLILDRCNKLLSLQMNDGEVINIKQSPEIYNEVVQEVDNILSLWHINQFLWKKFHFAFPSEGHSIWKRHIVIDHKTTNLLKRIWRWVSLYFNPWLNLWEKYMRGKYDISNSWMEEDEALEEFLKQNYILRKWLDEKSWYKVLDYFLFKKRIEKENNINAAKENISEHYDFGNQFYEKLLHQWSGEEYMQYSCGIDGNLYPEVEWLELRKEHTLEAFQWNKMKIHCEKMWLKPGMKVLDVGCGWGSLAKFMHDEYEVEVTGVTLSQEQFDLAIERNKWCEWVTIIKSDIRELPEGMKFDRIVSVGAFEHFRDFYHEFFQKSSEYLDEGWIMSLHTIGTSKKWEVARFFQKYIFPWGYLPIKQEVIDSSNDYFQLKEDSNFPSFEELWEHYARTIEFWIENLVNMKEEVILEHGEEKYRMILFYLVGSKVSFREGYSDLYQCIFEKKE